MGTLSAAAMKFLKENEQINQAYKTASVDGFAELPPDGMYVCEVMGFDFFESNKNGHEYLKTSLAVTEPAAHKGAPIDLIHVVTDPDKVGFLKRHLYALDVRLDELSQIITKIHEAAGKHVAVTVKTSAKTNDQGVPYRNAYVDNVVQPGNGSDLPSDVGTRGPVDNDDDLSHVF